MHSPAGGGRACSVTMHISHPDGGGREDLLQFVTNTLSSATTLLRNKFRSCYVIPPAPRRTWPLEVQIRVLAGLG